MTLSISLKEKIYFYSFEQLAFLSPRVFFHYLESTESFQLETPLQGLEDFQVCFAQLDSLLRTSEEIQIHRGNVDSFIFIAEKLENLFLLEVCFSISGNEVINLSLSSLNFKMLPSQSKKLLKKFTLVLNGQQIPINRSLFTCCSSLLLNIDLSVSSYSIDVSEEVFHCFLYFLKIFEGVPFYWKNFGIPAIFKMTKYFQIHSLKTFVDINLPPPSSFEEAIQFLSDGFIVSCPTLLRKSISILLENISLISFNQLANISVEAFQEVLKSDKFIIAGEKEEEFIDFIFQMIKKDANKKVLLKNIKLQTFSSKTLREFLSRIFLDEVDSELFAELKFCVQNFKEFLEDALEKKIQISDEIQTLISSKKKL
jgi:hypothetical protein